MPDPATLLLLRHGETDWNAERRAQGHDGPGLNAAGIAQARAAAESLRGQPLAAIYSSDLERALDTAYIVAKALGLPVTPDPRLRERHNGLWQGRLFAEIDAEDPGRRARWWADPLDAAPPGGESLRQVLERISPALDDIAARHPAERVLVVTHGGAMGVLRCALRGLPPVEVFSLIPANCEIETVAWPPAAPVADWLASSHRLASVFPEAPDVS